MKRGSMEADAQQKRASGYKPMSFSKNCEQEEGKGETKVHRKVSALKRWWKGKIVSLCRWMLKMSFQPDYFAVTEKHRKPKAQHKALKDQLLMEELNFHS
ncbi:hypothetical protein U0070_015087 [Myodes glareolus]|uniref:Uncharacterized protein n=1 Tax=Myodes glareolus TaxID=447135 RepID=A0AAW0JXB6_MYOGA